MNLIALQDIVDRVQETQRFQSLLEFRTNRRIFAVSDDSGWGKSTLLRKLRHVCVRSQIPVALIFINELSDFNEFTLITEIADQLRRVGVEFPSFDELNGARARRDVSRFMNTYRSVQGTVNAEGASIHGGQVAGVINNFQHSDAMWSDEAEKVARLLCLDAFLADLFATARQQAVVIIADALDGADEDLQRWLLLTLVMNGVIEKSDHKLVVVLSGENLSGLLEAYFDQCDEQFEFVDALCSAGTWCLTDTAKMLQVHKLDGLDEMLVGHIHDWISARKVSLAHALSVADLIKKGMVSPL